jgi:hypothetical protein
MPRESSKSKSSSSSAPKKEKVGKDQQGLRELVQKRIVKDVFKKTAGRLRYRYARYVHSAFRLTKRICVCSPSRHARRLDGLGRGQPSHEGLV